MATTKIFPIKNNEIRSLRYIADPDKTDGGRLIRTYYCSDDPAEASQDFQDFRDLGTGKNTVLSQHFIQSFLPGEITPEKALEVGEELCRRLLKPYKVATSIGIYTGCEDFDAMFERADEIMYKNKIERKAQRTD